MDFEKKEFYGIVAKAKKQMQITIDQDCNVADTKPDVEKMIQTRGIVKIQETEMMVDRVVERLADPTIAPAEFLFPPTLVPRQSVALRR